MMCDNPRDLPGEALGRSKQRGVVGCLLQLLRTSFPDAVRNALGFVGGGAAWNDFERFENSLTILTGGTGLRYELARKYGLHMGMDLAFGPDDPAIYVQFGSAWMRP